MQTLYLGLIVAAVAVVILFLYMSTKENFDAYGKDDTMAVYTKKAAQGLGVKELDDAEYPNNRQPTEYEKMWYTKGHHAAIQKEVLDSIDEIHQVEKSLDTLTTKFVSFQAETTENFKAYGKKMDDFKAATDANFKTYGDKLSNLSGSFDDRFGKLNSSIAANNANYEKAFNDLKANASNDMSSVKEEIKDLKKDNDAVQQAVDALKLSQDKMQKAYLALVAKQSDINKKQRDLQTVAATTSATPIIDTDVDSE
jgi:chromosome segregation ATPase